MFSKPFNRAEAQEINTSFFGSDLLSTSYTKFPTMFSALIFSLILRSTGWFKDMKASGQWLVEIQNLMEIKRNTIPGLCPSMLIMLLRVFAHFQAALLIVISLRKNSGIQQYTFAQGNMPTIPGNT